MTGPVVERSNGPAAHRPRIETGIFGPWRTNAYLVWDGRSADALVLDPGMGAAAPLVERATANGLDVHLIGNSHGHIDHVFDNAALHAATGAPIGIHPDDAHRLAGDNAYGFALEPSRMDRALREGDEIVVGDLVFAVLHTPGHTEGSICLFEERRGLLLSGDTLFAGSYGRTDLPGGSDEAMVVSLRRLVELLPPPTRVLPGHGPETTIEREGNWMRRIAQAGRLLIPG